MDEAVRNLQRDFAATGSADTAERLVRNQLRMGLQNLSTEEFEALGRAWFEENLKRNPLPTEDDVGAANYATFYADCECNHPCACVNEETCCASCEVGEDCTACGGHGFIIKADCPKCHGVGMYWLLDTEEHNALNREERMQLINELEAEEEKLLESSRIIATNLGDRPCMDDVFFDFFSRAIKALGGELIPHPIKEWGSNVAVLLPKYPLPEA